MKKYKKSPYIKYKENPFVEHQTSPFMVDKDEVQFEFVNNLGNDFLDQYINLISSEKNLGQAGRTALAMLFWTISDSTSQNFQQNRVLVNRSTAEDFLKTSESVKFSQTTFKRGMNELLDAGLIAKGASVGTYFVSPLINPKTNRIVITKIIER